MFYYHSPIKNVKPLARVTGYYAGHCTIEPMQDNATVFPIGLVLYGMNNSLLKLVQAAEQYQALINKGECTSTEYAIAEENLRMAAITLGENN